ncbi:uncharacterized protein J3R85_018416 [Psidium guajava]|nr:uncharacterized protein J3R85_018416 [Psidium guajava]
MPSSRPAGVEVTGHWLRCCWLRPAQRGRATLWLGEIRANPSQKQVPRYQKHRHQKQSKTTKM